MRTSRKLFFFGLLKNDEVNLIERNNVRENEDHHLIAIRKDVMNKENKILKKII